MLSGSFWKADSNYSIIEMNISSAALDIKLMLHKKGYIVFIKTMLNCTK